MVQTHNIVTKKKGKNIKREKSKKKFQALKKILALMLLMFLRHFHNRARRHKKRFSPDSGERISVQKYINNNMKKFLRTFQR